jgi:hypothetical protein
VYALDGAEAEILGRFYRAQVLVLHPGQHVVGARRHFEAGLELPIYQFTTAVVQMVIIRVDRQHFLFSAG